MRSQALENWDIALFRRVINQFFNTIGNKELNQRNHSILLDTHSFYGNESLWKVWLGFGALLLLPALLLLWLLLGWWLGLLGRWYFGNLFAWWVFVWILIACVLVIGFFLLFNLNDRCWFLLFWHFSLEFSQWHFIEDELKLTSEVRIVV